MEVSLLLIGRSQNESVAKGCLPDAIGEQQSIPLFNLRKMDIRKVMTNDDDPFAEELTLLSPITNPQSNILQFLHNI